MKLTDGPVILRHAFKWASVRACRRKYKQIRGTPQGLHISVGIIPPRENKKAHERYVLRPRLKERFTRFKLIDDVMF